MRVSYFVLATFATFVASISAKAISADSITKNKFMITSPDSSEALEAVYIKDGNDKYLILHLNDYSTEGSSTEASSEKNGASYMDDFEPAGQEERAISAGAADKLKKALSGNYDKVWNNVMWKFWNKMTPKRGRLPDDPRIPPRLRKILTPG